MTDKTMREEIAEHLIAYSYWLTSHYESVGQNALEAARRADAILAISEIQEGQELLEKAKSASGDECWICHAPLSKDGHCMGEALVPSESQKAGIDHCGGHDVFEPVCKYCQAVKDGTLENDNPRHWGVKG